MSYQPESPTTTPVKKPEIIPAFYRNEYIPGLVLDTKWGPVNITPHKDKWCIYACVRGSAVGQHFPNLRQAMHAAMRLRNVMSSKLVQQCDNVAQCEVV